jgi:GT2 family glycosyltransferase
VPRVSVVIPNWNGRDLLRGCLESLRGQTFRDFRVIVVDNGSIDDSVAMVQSHFPEVTLIRHAENLGFSAAMNAGIVASTGDFVVALNNDTEADPGFLEALVSAMDCHAGAGLATARILDFANRNVIDTLGDGYSWSGLSFKIGARSRADIVPADPFEVFGACAAAAIYRRPLFDDIGLFDPDFFAYMEDVDLSFRARLAGYGCLSVPGAVVFHMGSASTGGGASATSVRLTSRNIIWVIAKNIPGRLLPRVLVSATAVQAAAVAQCLLTGKNPWLRKNLRAYGRGLLEAAMLLPAMMRKRRAVQRLRRISPRVLSQMMDDSQALRRRFAPAPLAKPGSPP